MGHEALTGGGGGIALPLETDRMASSAAESRLAAREYAVLAREQAVSRREEAAGDLAQRRALVEAHITEANEHLVVATVRAIKMFEAAEQATQQMSHKAERDVLTGLPNRALLADRLAQSIELARRHVKKVVLMVLDLDRFKSVNDSLGHTVGDQLLQSIAKRLQACVRHSDTVSRQGGDEFLVLLTEVETPQDATQVAEKLIKAIAEPYDIMGHQLLITASIGISLFPDDAENVETALNNADTAMYRAKKIGRNNYQRFTSGIDAGSDREH